MKRRWMFGAVNTRWEWLAVVPWVALVAMLVYVVLGYTGVCRG
jgi:hypothetical protein